ncbi:MAG: 2-oxoglutarate and iron-dependent oxygenase domain-containing protein [Pseudomonadota bacterium]
MNSLPNVDISALYESYDTAARNATLSSLEQAYHDTGFAALVGHPIPATLITEMREQVRLLFQRPLAEKRSLCISQDNYRGYIPIGFFTPNAGSDEADYYEGYKLHEEISLGHPLRTECSLYGPNKWPENSDALQSAVSAYWQHCDQLRDVLLSAFAEIVGQKPNYFQNWFDVSLSNMTLLHYPASERSGDHYGIHPHKDTDMLTILAPDPVGGLMLRPKQSGEWINADALENTLIVNVGDMLEIWSNEYFTSTPHKVVNTSGLERYSFPYFAVPGYDTLIRPEPTANKSKDKAVDREMHCGEVSAKIWSSNWPDAAAIENRYDPYIN